MLPKFRTAAERSDFITWANRQIWLYGCDLETEWRQATEEGRDLRAVAAEFRKLRGTEPRTDYLEKLISGRRDLRWFERALALIERVQSLPLRRDYPYVEPDDLQGIRMQRGRGPTVPRWRGTKAQFAERVRGGFLGRVAGCMLGKPFEGVDRASIRMYAEETGNWPLRAYQRQPTPAELRRILRRKPLRPLKSWQLTFYIGLCDGFPSDDDINYTVLGMEVMRRHGANFTPLDMVSLWAQQLPVLATCTAERAAFNQFLAGWLPPRSASRRNPYREWIGAQIRADFFGYAAPGKPALAAEWAWRDASISHVKNGIYGEMWVAAMLAAAFVLTDWPAIIRAGLAQIPRRSRLHAGIEHILALSAAGVPYDEVVNGIHREWNELTVHGWVHTISNAQVVAAALLYGGDDYGTTIARAVSSGFDTDCNGATCGSLWGVKHGAKALPRRWLSPLKNKLKTNLADYPVMPLDEMAERMVTVAEAVRG